MERRKTTSPVRLALDKKEKARMFESASNDLKYFSLNSHVTV